MNDYPHAKQAVIVCSHVLEQAMPVLFAQRDQPDRPEDSGWQITCNVHNEDGSTGRVIAVEEAIRLDSTLLHLFQNPYQTCFIRLSRDHSWEQVLYTSTLDE